MEQRSEQAIIQQFQPLLRKFENDDGLEIIHADEEPGTKVGENYLSIVTRTTINGLRGDGTPYKKSFMRKALLTDEKLNEFARAYDIFLNESHIYRNVLPLLGSFGPECISATPHEIITEDLRLKNFSILQRRKMLDFEHCKAVMQTFAAFHAASLALSLKNPTEFQKLIEQLKEVAYPSDDKPALGRYIPDGLRHVVHCLEQIPERTEKIDNAIHFLNELVEDSYNKMEKLVRYRGKYRVLNHGDSWNNNILFLHDQNGNVKDVKLIDFQLSRLYSPASDLFYFLYSSAKSEVIEKRLNDLLEVYHEKFISELRRLSVPEDDIRAVSFSWLKDELKKFGVFGLSIALMTTHAVFTEENEKLPVDIEDVDKGEDWVKKIPMSAEKNERFRVIMESCMRYI